MTITLTEYKDGEVKTLQEIRDVDDKVKPLGAWPEVVVVPHPDGPNDYFSLEDWDPNHARYVRTSGLTL